MKIHLTWLILALIHKGEVYTAGQEGHLSETCHQCLPVVTQHLEDGVVAQETLRGACIVGIALTDLVNLGHRYATFEALPVNFAIALDSAFHPLAQGIHGADTNAM